MYRVVPAGDDVSAAIDALPGELIPAFAELRAALEVSPWTVGWSYMADNPTGMRIAEFGRAASTATVVYGVIERDRLVTLIQLAVY